MVHEAERSPADAGGSFYQGEGTAAHEEAGGFDYGYLDCWVKVVRDLCSDYSCLSSHKKVFFFFFFGESICHVQTIWE